MLSKDSALKGKTKNFPITLEGYYEDRTYETREELIETIWDEYEKRLKSKQEQDSKDEIKIKDVCWYFGLEDTVILIDDRTIDLLRKFQFFKNTPDRINKAIWFEAYLIMDNLTPRLF